MFTRVTPEYLFLGRRPSLDPPGKVLQESREPRLRLRVVVRRMKLRERWVRQEVDRRMASASAASEPVPCARPTR
jgi:hypothetical protein